MGADLVIRVGPIMREALRDDATLALAAGQTVTVTPELLLALLDDLRDTETPF